MSDVPASDRAEPEDTVEEIEVRTPTPDELGLDLPEDPEEAIGFLLRTLAEAGEESAGHRDGHLRALAEMDNMRKRSLRDRTTFIEQATERLMHKLLPVLDAFQAGLDWSAETEGEQRLLEGLRQTYDQLADVLGSEGLTSIEAEGEPFNPALHDAVSVLGEGDDLVVLHQMRRGFRLRDRVLRPASVVVGPADSRDDDQGESGQE